MSNWEKDTLARLAESLKAFNEELRAVVREYPKEEIVKFIEGMPPEWREQLYSDSLKHEDYEICGGFKLWEEATGNSISTGKK